MLPCSDRRSRLQHEEGGDAVSENELDLHIEDVLRSVLGDTAGLLLLTDAIANEIGLNEL